MSTKSGNGKTKGGKAAESKSAEGAEVKAPASNPPAAPKPGKLKTGWANPADLLIIGLDIKPGEPGYDPQLEDPDRIKNPPDADAIKHLIEFGYDKPVGVVEVKINGKTVKLIFDGRQRTMTGRAANETLPDGHKLEVPYYVREQGATALDVTRANEFARIDSPLTKARRAARLKALGYSEPDIIGAFSSNGARPISKMTLHNWKVLLKCAPAILDLIESGEIPVAIGYELGKLPEGEQAAALEKIRAEGGTLRGESGRANAKEAAGGEGGEGDGSGGGGKRAKSGKMSAAQIKQVAEIFSDDEDFDDDYQRLTGAIFSVIVGDDPTGKGLRDFPTVHKHFKKILRSPRKDADKQEG